MYLTGFADEAAVDIDGQIRATRELDWHNIESRNINGANIHDMPDEDFAIVCDKLKEHNIKINCFGSAIGNWSQSVTDPFEQSVEMAKRAITRMNRLGTKLIRIMSYKLIEGKGPEEQMEQERFRRLRKLQKMFSGAGITVVHENCSNYGGMGYNYTLKLIENVPGLKLVFDTGNPMASDDCSKTMPYPKQSSWEFYKQVKDHIEYLHVKDGVWDATEQKATYTFPGEGSGEVKRVVKDFLDRGYDGGISMEPHMAVVFHDSSIQSAEEIKYANYVEYGRRFMKLLEDIGYSHKLTK